MTIDLRAPENADLCKRLTQVQVIRSKMGGHDEREDTTEYDTTTGKFYFVEWWSDFTCRGDHVSSGHTAEEMTATPELLALVAKS